MPQCSHVCVHRCTCRPPALKVLRYTSKYHVNMCRKKTRFAAAIKFRGPSCKTSPGSLEPFNRGEESFPSTCISAKLGWGHVVSGTCPANLDPLQKSFSSPQYTLPTWFENILNWPHSYPDLPDKYLHVPRTEDLRGARTERTDLKIPNRNTVLSLPASNTICSRGEVPSELGRRSQGSYGKY